MRGWGRSTLAFAAVAVVASAAPDGARAGASCASAMPSVAARLPAPIVVTTDCGRYRFERSGRLRFRAGFALPVPAGAAYYMDLTWYRLRGGRLVIGHRKQTLWRSRARFEGRYVDIGAVASGHDAVAYSIFHGRRQSLFVAHLGRPERLIATGEHPLGFTTRGGLICRRRWALLLRSGPDWRPRRLIRAASDVVFDHAAQAAYFVVGGRIERFDGARIARLATLASLRVGRRPQIEPLGRLVAVHSLRRLVVLRLDGTVLASMQSPRPVRRADVGISSALAADGDADAVAFTVARGNTASSSDGRELVYVLRPRATAARLVFRARMSFAGCARGAELAWRGRWLLYSNSEGRVALIDTGRPDASVDLSVTVARLPGMGGDRGRFDVVWA
jgi:hypothetical protein